MAWALVSDLFVRVRVEGLARREELATRFFADAEGLLAALAGGGAGPDLLLVDLSARDEAAWRLLDSLAALREREQRVPPVLAFYSHVEGETRRRALALGADRVVPRSAFVARFHHWIAELVGPPPGVAPGAVPEAPDREPP